MSEYRLYNNLIMPPQASVDDAVAEAKRVLGISSSVDGYIYRESLDCRRGNVKKVFTVALRTDDNRLKEIKEYVFTPVKKRDESNKTNSSLSPYIIGMGPCGIFCALTLLEHGIKPVLIDRGSPVEKRVKDVEVFFNGGELNESSNVQFGEGGAGTFSDGKLNTGINDPRSRKVLETYVRFGADPDIMYKAKPHIGTDILRTIAVNIRKYILSNGGQMLFDTRLEDVIIRNGRVAGIICNGTEIKAEPLILATGNGAFDVYEILMQKGVRTEPKPISVGIRQEYLQSDIDSAKYGHYAGKYGLEPANYSFSSHLPSGLGLYTFCMCPGGFVVNSSSSHGACVTNGMSYRARDGRNANSALLVSFSPRNEKEAMDICRGIEKAAYKEGRGMTPVCTYSALINNDFSDFKGFDLINPTVRPEGVPGDFSKIFPHNIFSALQTAATGFTDGFFGAAAAGFGNGRYTAPVFTAPETRTSAPVRIVRDEDGMSVGIKGLYPCGEGAGYAGGIVSSAVDGIRAAEHIINSDY